MKIGVMTLWGCSNYGQNLQAFALQKSLRNAGHDAFLIRYPLINFFGDVQKPPKPPLWKQFLQKTLPPFLLDLYRLRKKACRDSLSHDPHMISVPPRYEMYRDPAYDIHLRKIYQFLQKYLTLSPQFYANFAELEANPPEADAYITGSDQVWNFWGQPLRVAREETLRAFLLDFGKPEVKRLAYAASFGTRVLRDTDIQLISPLMRRLQYVTVREESTLDLCTSCGVQAEWVPDPVLLLDAEEYREVYRRDEIAGTKKPYCLVYMVRSNPAFLRSVSAWAHHKKIDVKLILNTGLIQHGYHETFASIPEWLYLIDNATCVLTDSYHGVLVSLIFGKNFGVIPFSGRDTDLRRIDVHKRFALENRYMETDNFEILDHETPTKSIAATLAHIRGKYNKTWWDGVLSEK